MKYKPQVYAFCVGILLLTAASFAPAQEKLRTVEHGKYRKYDIKTEPIAIVGRQLGNKPFINDNEVMGRPDWLRDLTLDVRNISNKTIKDFEINVVIEKQDNMPFAAGMSLRFPTQEPILSLNGKPAGEYNAPKLLKPGEIVKVKVSDNMLRILDDLKKDGVVDILRVYLAFTRVRFDDGTGWFQGMEMREDPKYPGSMIQFALDYRSC